MYTKSNFCNNCGKYGHSYHQCKLPIISSGIILVCNINNTFYYLMIRRKDTLGYVDFLRGRYNDSNLYHLKNIIDEMTNTEKRNLLNEEFKDLWNNLWSINSTQNTQYKIEEKTSKKKLEKLKSDKLLDKLIKECKSNWEEPEWGFPKGRRNYLEKDIDCAIREFEDAIDDCKAGCVGGINGVGATCNSLSTAAVHAWDEGVAFYTGSREGAAAGGSTDGVLSYRLAEKRCANFKTCGPNKDSLTGTSYVR